MKSLKRFARLLMAMALLISGLSSCTQEGAGYADRHGGKVTNLDDESLEKACEALQQVGDVYMECSTIGDLEERAEDIAKIENVEKVYFFNISMFVKVKDFMTVSFSFFPQQEDIPLSISEMQTSRQMMTRAEIISSLSQLGLEKGVIIDNQLDEGRAVIKQNTKETLDRAGIRTDYKDKPSLSFYEEGMFDYDVVVIYTHGKYDPDTKLHWILVNDLFDYSQYKIYDWKEKLMSFFQKKDNYKGYILDEQISVDFHQDTGRTVLVPQLCISEKFFSSQGRRFKKDGKAIVYNVACQSLMGGKESKTDKNERDFSLAKAFVDRGAGVYFGYDESNGAGQAAGLVFVGSLASGLSVKSAYNSIPPIYMHNVCDDSEDDKPATKTWTADLLFYPENNFGIENYCQVSPTLKDKEDKDEYVVFNATSPYNMWFYPENSNWTFNKFSGFKYGFELSTTKDFSQTKDLNGLQIDDNTIITNYTVSFSHSLPSKELEPETQYYYRAYLNDGTNIYYSDPKEFTTPARISQVIPEDIRKKMEPYIPIYDGASPPNIEGVYLMDSPRIVFDATGTIDSDYDGFAPMYFKISNQDMTNNTLDFQERQIANGKVISEGEGYGAFISGEGSKFSVFFNTTDLSHTEEYDATSKTALVISGTKASDGIHNLRYAFVVVEKGADPNNHIMDVGDFRVFKDNDELAKTSDWKSHIRSREIIVRGGQIKTPWSKLSVKR